jgi:hypothetical protein
MSGHTQAVACVCGPGDACDWHAIMCVTCPDGCEGHPGSRVVYATAGTIGAQSNPAPIQEDNE